MDLTQLANLGEFIGGVAVLVTLVYLAVQVQSGSTVAKASTVTDMTSTWMTFCYQVWNDDDLTLLSTAALSPETLDERQLQKLWWWTRAAFRGYENNYFQHKSGIFDDEVWGGYRSSLRREVFASAGVRAMWTLQRYAFAPSFVDFVDREVEEVRKAGAPPEGSSVTHLIASGTWKNLVDAERPR